MTSARRGTANPEQEGQHGHLARTISTGLGMLGNPTGGNVPCQVGCGGPLVAAVAMAPRRIIFDATPGSLNREEPRALLPRTVLA